MELYGPSSKARTHFSCATRPIKNVGTPFPLSESSPFLELDDPVTHQLLARKDAEAEAKLDKRRFILATQRAQRHKELARRICERETVENYIQTPFGIKRGNRMEFGFNVTDGAHDRDLTRLVPFSLELL